MPRRTTAIAAALSVLALGSPLITANANPLATQYFDQGVEKYDAGDYQGAMDEFNKAIEIISQKSYDAFTFRGIVKDQLEDYQGAITDYNKAIEIDPQDAYAYYFRGSARESVNDLEGACDDWRKRIDLGDNDSAERLELKC